MIYTRATPPCYVEVSLCLRGENDNVTGVGDVLPSHSPRNPIFSALIFTRRINEAGIHSSRDESADSPVPRIAYLIFLSLSSLVPT